MAALELDFRYGAGLGLDIENYAVAAKAAQRLLERGEGPGSEYLGWLELPSSYSKQSLAPLKEAAELIQKSEALVLMA